MKILAFMQNMWVKDPARVEKLIKEYGESYRRRLIKYLLFAGCHSGRRLKQALGEDLCEKIHWDEVSREISNNSRFIPEPDFKHIKETIKHYQPDIIICFGKLACDSVSKVWNGKLIFSPHPAARQVDVMNKLKSIVNKLSV